MDSKNEMRQRLLKRVEEVIVVLELSFGDSELLEEESIPVEDLFLLMLRVTALEGVLSNILFFKSSPNIH